ncbi:MAG TPA: TlyA family RNA methyltransferase [Tepidisphaeraceae bacterium]|jgi:23S rRNA (cytidine1920-2'-O)/16S rRNA (cytidine1409-2'-O)-methyltransferase|nr:TlyA family RNA methyltransferase [Tepidisphaeraceae bacterium]
MSEFVSRAGQKLEQALATFGIDVSGWVCADLGSNVGGFVDCLLQRGVKKVYAIDTGYGALEWKLRKDPRVVVMERTNAMHVNLPETVKLVTIDVAWTKQKNILPAARKMLQDDGIAITLIKPQYEAGVSLLKKGVLPSENLQDVLEEVKGDIAASGFHIIEMIESPIRGGEGNVEMLAHLRPA